MVRPSISMEAPKFFKGQFRVISVRAGSVTLVTHPQTVRRRTADFTCALAMGIL